MRRIILLFVVGSLILGARLIEGEAFAETKKEGVPLLIMVSGKVLIEDNYILLESDAGKNYILIGNLSQKLRKLEGKRVTVMGKPILPKDKKIQDREIRLIIDVEKLKESKSSSF